MKQNLYSVYDRVAQQYGPPFQAINDGVARRQYNRLMSNEGVSHDDYRLYLLGSYDTSTGVLLMSHSEVVIDAHIDALVEV